MPHLNFSGPADRRVLTIAAALVMVLSIFFAVPSFVSSLNAAPSVCDVPADEASVPTDAELQSLVKEITDGRGKGARPLEPVQILVINADCFRWAAFDQPNLHGFYVPSHRRIYLASDWRDHGGRDLLKALLLHAARKGGYVA